MSVIIRLQLLPLSAAASDVRSFFHGLKIPDGAVHIVGGEEGDAFIGFASDDDARQAMRRDRGMIHGDEVRLYLSSRNEMNEVIAKAKAAVFAQHSTSSVRAPEPPNLSRHGAPPVSHENGVQASSSGSGSYVAEKPSVFAPDTSDYNKPAYMRMPLPASSVTEPYNGIRGGAQQHPNNGQQIPPAPRYFPPTPSTSRDNAMSHQAGPPNFQQPGFPREGHGKSAGVRMYRNPVGPYPASTGQVSAPRNGPGGKPAAQPPYATPVTTGSEQVQMDYQQQEPCLSSNKAVQDALSKLPAHLRPPFGIPPPHLRHLFPAPSLPKPPDLTKLPPLTAPTQSSATTRDERKPSPPRLPSSQNGYVAGVTNGPTPICSVKPPTIAIRNESWRENAPGPINTDPKKWEAPKSDHHNGPSGVVPGRKTLLNSNHLNKNENKSTPIVSNTSSQLHEGIGLPGASSRTEPSSVESSQNRMAVGPPSFLPTAVPSSSGAVQSPRYMEMSRLPTDMLRPTVLEQFIKPSVPLSLTSVKVVYSSEGILLHTLVRLENEADATNLLRKDGEQGIRIRPTTRSIFEESIDGPIVPNLARMNEASSNRISSSNDHRHDRLERDSRRRRSRSPSGRGRRNLREVRRDDRSRSRSPVRGHGRDVRRRGRSRSPPRRKGRQEPNRWCLQLTNLPFRVSEDDIRSWLSERVKPSRLVRTFYADGNASDRWVAEFESETLMERARGVKALLLGRTIRMSYIDNDFADEIIAIEDKYGESKKSESEIKQMAQLQMQQLNATSSQPALPPPLPMMRGRGAMNRGPGRGMPPPPFGVMMPSNGGAPRPLLLPPGMPPIMAPDCARASSHRAMSVPPPSFFRGRGRGRPAPPRMSHPFNNHHQTFNQKPPPYRTDKHDKLPEELPSHASEALDSELIASIGAKGCVLVCSGFPPDITLQDVVGFFNGYDVDENSVRMKMGDDGIATGECMLAVKQAESAAKAVNALNGKNLRNHKVSMLVAS